MSPGSSRRERTTASAGAFSSPCEIWCRSSASWACVACNWASAPAMSSLRGPASARRSASRCSSAWAWATCAALRARSMSWALTPRPCVLAAMPRSPPGPAGHAPRRPARRRAGCAPGRFPQDASRCAGAAASVAARPSAPAPDRPAAPACACPARPARRRPARGRPLRRAVPARGHCRRRPARSGGCPRCRSRRDRRRCRAGCSASRPRRQATGPRRRR